jgi:hypothetical protein
MATARLDDALFPGCCLCFVSRQLCHCRSQQLECSLLQQGSTQPEQARSDNNTLLWAAVASATSLNRHRSGPGCGLAGGGQLMRPAWKTATLRMLPTAPDEHGASTQRAHNDAATQDAPPDDSSMHAHACAVALTKPYVARVWGNAEQHGGKVGAVSGCVAPCCTGCKTHEMN